MAQKSTARKNRQSKQPGDNPTKNGWTNPKKESEKAFYGELSRHVKNYRDLPADDPLRVHIESLVGTVKSKGKNNPIKTIGEVQAERRRA